MLRLLGRKEPPELYPGDHERLHEGVYNRWKSTFLDRRGEEENRYTAMSGTIEYFVLTEVNNSKTHVVRVTKEINDTTGTRFFSNYSEDSKIFGRPIAQVTAADVMNAYPLSDFEKRYCEPKDHFGLRRVGTLDEFVERMKDGGL